VTIKGKLWTSAAAGLLILSILSACDLPALPPSTSLPPTVALNTATAQGGGCDASSLVAPGIPSSEEVIVPTLQPELSWIYDGPCPPDGFRLEVAPGGEFASPDTLIATTDGVTTSWRPARDLQPATRYAWRVAARSGSALGPYSISQTFFTGPTCDGADLQAPSPVSPEQEGIVNDPSPILEWSYPVTSCLQETYNFEVSADPAFSSPVLAGHAGPATAFETEIGYLVDCTPYFWRVRAVYGEDISGPYSAVGIFFCDFVGGCTAHSPLPRVTGVVWSDQCESIGVIPGEAPPPPGCVYREGAYGADGIRQPSEAGIEGVTIRYSPGGCPPSGNGATVWEPTGSDGAFAQVLTPGTYCFWLERAGDANEAVLGEGLLTYPPGGYDAPSNYEVTLAWGEVRAGLDFGWDRR
jgi:hypothetical protein